MPRAQEGLAPNATHDSISSVFSKFGTIKYIRYAMHSASHGCNAAHVTSLPRFANKKRSLKGFGFIEFDTPAQAKAATTAFLPKVSVRYSRCSVHYNPR